MNSWTNDYLVAWWNVENLFTEVDDPARHPWLQRHLGREPAGWTTEVLSRKPKQLASVMTRMNDGRETAGAYRTRFGSLAVVVFEDAGTQEIQARNASE